MKHHHYKQENDEKHRNTCFMARLRFVFVFVCVYIYSDFAVFILFRAEFVLTIDFYCVCHSKKKIKAKQISSKCNISLNEIILD